jgi:hypothetical protein
MLYLSRPGTIGALKLFQSFTFQELAEVLNIKGRMRC